MQPKASSHTAIYLTLFIFLLSLFYSGQKASAHCDRENGPVAKAAVKALETGDFDKIVIWVGEEQEEELKERFDQALEVYRQGGASKELAEQYFMETAVRLHRAAEGMPYTGLKPASPNPPDIEAAEKALDSGNVQPLLDLMCSELEQETREWFNKTIQAAETKEQSVENGREWVDAYVKYIVFVHKLYEAIQEGPPHGVGD